MTQLTTVYILVTGLVALPVPAAYGQNTGAVDVARRYGEALRTLGEPDLTKSADTRLMYRVLWLRSFHDAIAVRIIRDGARLSVITKQGPVWGHPDGRTPVRSDSTALSQLAWDNLMKRTALREFWTTEAAGPRGVDGAEWILEARQPGRYHAVDWWSPQSEDGVEGGYRRLVLEILSLGRVCIKPDALY